MGYFIGGGMCVMYGRGVRALSPQLICTDHFADGILLWPWSTSCYFPGYILITSNRIRHVHSLFKRRIDENRNAS
jgi:hypothetical protein